MNHENQNLDYKKSSVDAPKFELRCSKCNRILASSEVHPERWAPVKWLHIMRDMYGDNGQGLTLTPCLSCDPINKEVYF